MSRGGMGRVKEAQIGLDGLNVSHIESDPLHLDLNELNT